MERALARLTIAGVLVPATLVALGASPPRTIVRDSAAFVASTPCDAAAKSLLAIAPGEACDFVRWNLSIREDVREFALRVQFGEAQPNTLGFTGGGETRSFSGTYEIATRADTGGTRTIYRLGRGPSQPPIALLEVNDNLFQILDAHGEPMLGNGGWSFSLNREQPIRPAPNPAFTLTSRPFETGAVQTVFEGRTPCREVAVRVGLETVAGCFKVKWNLTLNRDPATHRPTTYQLDRTGHRGAPIVGRWAVVEAAGLDNAPAIVRLDPGSPTSLSFLALDDSLLFFLDENDRLLPGNGDFSYTLNRRSSRVERN